MAAIRLKKILTRIQTDQGISSSALIQMKERECNKARKNFGKSCRIDKTKHNNPSFSARG